MVAARSESQSRADHAYGIETVPPTPVLPKEPHPEAMKVARHVDRERLWDRHMRLAEHGATPAGGVNRQALSAEDAAARQTLRTWATAIGLVPSADPVANMFLRLEGESGDLPPVVTGSHLDSQPTGGKFDGVYGVLAALEAVEAIVASGQRPRRSIEIVAWTNEEGSRFAPGMTGSAAFAGKRDWSEIRTIRDSDGVAFEDALDTLLQAESDIARKPLGFPLAAYVEAHIEQGPILEAQGLPTGVVTGIQGKRTFRVGILGEEAHAGTAPLDERKDALLAATRMIAALERTALDIGGETVKLTFGRLRLWPNAPSVVPGRAEFSIDLRHVENGVLERIGDRIPELFSSLKGPCEVEVVELTNDPSLQFPEDMRRLIRNSAAAIHTDTTDIYSAAGHDARYLHQVCPAGMIFVPCHKGISHNEAESATSGDLAAGARLLAAVILTLANS